MRRLARLAALALLACTTVPSTARTQNLVATPGFEAGPVSWTFTGPLTSIASTLPHTESFAARFGAFSSTGRATQTIATAPGAIYTFSFWLRNTGSGANAFAASFGPTTLLSLVDAPTFDYQQYAYDVLASDTATTLTFTGRNAPSYWYLDDVSVTPAGISPPTGTRPAVTAGALSHATVTPEPATLVLLGGGLAGVALTGRRRRMTTR